MNPSAPDTPGSAEQSHWFVHEVHPHEPLLRSYLRKNFPANRDIDDVVQESYLRIWKARAMQPIASAKAFLFKVARHIVIDSARRKAVSPVDVVTDISALSVMEQRPGAFESACTREEFALLADAIDSLPSRCRETVILRKLRGVPQKAIALQLGVSVQTVQVQVLRGVKRLEKFLSQWEGSSEVKIEPRGEHGYVLRRAR